LAQFGEKSDLSIRGIGVIEIQVRHAGEPVQPNGRRKIVSVAAEEPDSPDPTFRERSTEFVAHRRSGEVLVAESKGEQTTTDDDLGVGNESDPRPEVCSLPVAQASSDVVPLRVAGFVPRECAGGTHHRAAGIVALIEVIGEDEPRGIFFVLLLCGKEKAGEGVGCGNET
jgi:hypothetical protein